MMGWIALLLHAALLSLAAPALEWLVRRTGAWLRGETGPPMTQPLRDLVRLWRKPSLEPAGASLLFGAVPGLDLAAMALAMLLTPSFTQGMATSGAADLVLVLALLGLSRGLAALAAFDSGSASLAYAGNQAMVARLGTEPVLMLVALAVLLAAGATNLDMIAGALRDGAPGLVAAGAIAGSALLAATASAPAPPCVFSGRALALAQAAAMLRRVVVVTAAAALLLPAGMAAPGMGPWGWAVGILAFAPKLAVLGMTAALLHGRRQALPVAALLALIAAVVLGAQGRA